MNNFGMYGGEQRNSNFLKNKSTSNLIDPTGNRTGLDAVL